MGGEGRVYALFKFFGRISISSVFVERVAPQNMVRVRAGWGLWKEYRENVIEKT